MKAQVRDFVTEIRVIERQFDGPTLQKVMKNFAAKLKRVMDRKGARIAHRLSFQK